MGKPEKPSDAIAMPPRPIPLPVLPESIPAELKATNAWVMWRYVWKGKRWTKPPFKCNGGSASSTNPDTWASFSKAHAAYQLGGFDGIGIVLQDDIAGIDLDHCVSDDKWAPWAAEIVEHFKNTYIEGSPSGDGLRVLTRGLVEHSGKGLINKRIEVYGKGSARYLTITGQRLTHSPAGLTEQQRALDWLHTTHMRKPSARPGPKREPTPLALSDDDIIEKACSARNGEKFSKLFAGDLSDNASASEADMALCYMLAFWTPDAAQIDRIVRKSGLVREKWDEYRGDRTYGERTVAKALENDAERYSTPSTGFPGKGKPRELSVIWMRDICPKLTALWRVSKLLPEVGLAVIFGESGSGKTYLCLDLAVHVAAGREWCGRRCTPGVVVYIAAENPVSAENRIALWRQQYPECKDAPLAVLPSAVNLCDPQADLQAIIKLLEEIESSAGQIALVVVDTLARSMGTGDENSARDMGATISACDAIRDRFTTLVALVHHSGKDSSKGARGHSSLKAAVDVEIEVSKSAGSHFAKVTKLRDGATGATFAFKLVPAILGHDEEGEEVTACLVTELREMPETQSASRTKLSFAQQIALDELHGLIGSSGKCREASAAEIERGAQCGQAVAKVEDWRQACYLGGISAGDQDAKRQAFKRALRAFQVSHRVTVGGDSVWVTEGGHRTDRDKA